MKHLILILLTALVVTGCAGKDGSDGSNGSNGNDGITLPGQPGDNGHSIVSKSRPATNVECTQSNGMAADFYIDLDDSLNYSSGDLLQSGIVVCNGVDGSDGEDGEDGANGTNGAPGSPGSSATMTAIALTATPSACTLIHTGLYAKKWTNTDVALYSDAICGTQIDAGNNAILRTDVNEIYITGSVMLILEGTSSNVIIRKLVF